MPGMFTPKLVTPLQLLEGNYTADIPVEGTEGRHAVVRTGWIIAPESREAHLVTLYVRKKTI